MVALPAFDCPCVLLEKISRKKIGAFEL
jgi:hypothetical protein